MFMTEQQRQAKQNTIVLVALDKKGNEIRRVVAPETYPTSKRITFSGGFWGACVDIYNPPPDVLMVYIGEFDIVKSDLIDGILFDRRLLAMGQVFHYLLYLYDIVQIASYPECIYKCVLKKHNRWYRVLRFAITIMRNDA